MKPLTGIPGTADFDPLSIVALPNVGAEVADIHSTTSAHRSPALAFN
jgi:hypothetical protein